MIVEPNIKETKIEHFNKCVAYALQFLTNNINHVDITYELNHQGTRISDPASDDWNDMIEGDREVIIRIKESRSILFYISKHPNAVKLLNEMAAKEAEKKQD